MVTETGAAAVRRSLLAAVEGEMPGAAIGRLVDGAPGEISVV